MSSYLIFFILKVIEGIAKAIATTSGCTLLDVDPGVSTNRTVYTFVGSPEDVVKGALAGALAASQLIDMTTHTGKLIITTTKSDNYFQSFSFLTLGYFGVKPYIESVRNHYN